MVLSQSRWLGRRVPPPQKVIQKRQRHLRQLPPRRIDRVPVAQDRRPLDVEHRELPRPVERQRAARQRRDAEPGEDGLLDRFAAAELEARVERDAVLKEVPLDHDARARTFSRINQGSSAGGVLSPVFRFRYKPLISATRPNRRKTLRTLHPERVAPPSRAA